jgi:hypothetical protein
MGPRRRIIEKLESRWLQLAWPITWVTRVTQHRKFPGEKLPFPPTANQVLVRDGMRVSLRIRTAALIKAKVNTVGALYLRRMAPPF